MSAARHLLTLLLAAVLLVGCDTFNVAPNDPDTVDPGDETKPPPGPTLLWEEVFAYNQEPRNTRLAMTDNGHIFFGGSEYIAPPGDYAGIQQTNEHVRIFTPDGELIGKFDLGFGDSLGTLDAAIPIAPDTVLLAGEYADRHYKYSDGKVVTYLRAIDTAGNWDAPEPTIVALDDGPIEPLGGIPLDEGKAFLYGAVNGSFAHPNPTRSFNYWGAIIDTDTFEILTKVQFPDTEVALPIAAAYSPKPPPGAPTSNGVIYLLRQKQTPSDCETRSGTCYEGKIYSQPLLAVFDAVTGELLEPALALLEPSQNDVYQDIAVAPTGQIYLVGAYWPIHDNGSYGRLDTLMVVLDANVGLVKRVRDGGRYNEEIAYINVLPDGDLLLAGWSDGSAVGDYGYWPNQKGHGSAFIAKYTANLEREWVHMIGKPEERWEAVAAFYHPGHGYYLGGDKIETMGDDDESNDSMGHFLAQFEPEE